MIFQLLLLLLAIGSSTSANAEVSHFSTEPENIFILAGQSNMAGRGGIINGVWDRIVPPECKPNPLIRRLSANLTWEEANEPLHADIDLNKTCGIGPGMAFANSVLQRDPRLGGIGLVPCAVGATNISQWQRGGFLYNQLIRRSSAAVRGGGRVQAILWYQGESDTIDFQDALSYKSNLERFFNDVRADLHSPRLLIIQVALASGEGNIDVVRQAQLGIELPNVIIVDAKGSPLEHDNLHLTTPGQIRLGDKLAIAFPQTLSENRG